MRLIDADKFKGKVIASHTGSGVIKLIAIDEVLTAYDPDKIVEQLNDKFRVVRTDEDLEWNRAMDEAITIVKGSGVNAKTDS